MKKPQINQEKESRFLPESVELRAKDDEEKRTVFGYAAKFNVESENMGFGDFEFRETIAPGAFDDVLNDDVRALLNHDHNHVLARSKNGQGSLRLGADNVGLFYEFEAPDTQAGRDLLASIQRGDVDQSSFSFQVDRDGQDFEESQEGDGPIVARRTIRKIKRLFDVSPVTFPAYPDATVAVRSFEKFQQEQSPPEPEGQTAEQIAEVRDWAALLGLNPAQQNKD